MPKPTHVMTNACLCTLKSSQASALSCGHHMRWKAFTNQLSWCLQVQTMDYSCIVFDTAPTGHTLRLLQFPTVLQKGLSKLVGLKATFGGMFSQVAGLMGMGDGQQIQDQLLGKLEELKVSSAH